MIEVRVLTKKYGSKYAVNNISFDVKKGEVVGLLGRNGAGKTTTMNIMTGYIAPTSGTVMIDGFDIAKQPIEAKSRIGYMPEQPPLYTELTVEEYLCFISRLKGVNKNNIKNQVEHALEMANIEDVRKRLIGNLSKGYRQRVGLAQALCGDPQVIILDEPTAGLDPKQIIDIRNTIKKLRQNHTVILSSHILHEVADVCSKIIIINQGEIIKDDMISNLISQNSGQRLSLKLTGTEKQGRKVLEGLKEVRAVTCKGANNGNTEFIVDCTDGAPPTMIYDAVKMSSLKIVSMNTLSESLEDVFLKLTDERKEA